MNPTLRDLFNHAWAAFGREPDTTRACTHVGERTPEEDFFYTWNFPGGRLLVWNPQLYSTPVDLIFNEGRDYVVGFGAQEFIEIPNLLEFIQREQILRAE